MNITKDRRVWARRVLAAMVFFSPLVFSRATTGVFDLVKLTLLWVCGVIALALFVARAAEREVWWPKSGLFQAAGVLVAITLVATIFSRAPIISFIGAYVRYGGLVSLVLYGAIMLTVAGIYWERPADLDDVAKAAVAAALLMSVYVVLQAGGLDWIPWRSPEGGYPTSPIGTMGNSNFAGGYLGIVAPLAVYLIARARSVRTRAILAAGLGLILSALWFTATRGGMVGCLTGLATTCWFYRRMMPKMLRLGGAVAVIAATVLAVFVLIGPKDRIPAGVASVFRSETLVDRVNYWTSAVRIMKDHPVLGTGPDTFYASYPRYRLRADGAKNASILPDEPHNIFFEHGVGAGLSGLASYLVLVGLALLYGARSARRLEGAERMLLVAFLSMLASYLAQGFFAIDVPALAVMGWLALGAIAAIAAPARPDSLNKPRGQKFGATLAIAAVLFAIVGTLPAAADVRSKTARRSDKTLRGIEGYRQALKLNPLEASYHQELMILLETRSKEIGRDRDKEKVLAEAVSEGQRALNLRPRQENTLVKIAQITTSWAEDLNVHRFAQAVAWWKTVSELDPYNFELHEQYASTLESWAGTSRDPRSLLLQAANQREMASSLRTQRFGNWMEMAVDYSLVSEPLKARRALDGFFGFRIEEDAFRAAYEQLSRTTARPRASQSFQPHPVATGRSLSIGAIQTTNSGSWRALLHSSEAPGALVLDAPPGSPAALAGLQRGDVITEVDSLPVKSEEQATVLLQNTRQRHHEIRVVKPDGRNRPVKIVSAQLLDSSTEQYASEVFRSKPGPVSEFIYARSEPDSKTSSVVLAHLVARLPDFAPGYALRARRLSETLGPTDSTNSPAAQEKEAFAVRENIQKAVQLEPESLFVREAAATAALSIRDFREAEAQSLAALEINPLSARSQSSLGRSRLAANGTAGASAAIEPLRRAVELNPYAPGYLRSLIQAYKASGMIPQANAAAKSLDQLSAGSRAPTAAAASRSSGKSLAKVVWVTGGVIVLAAASAARLRGPIDK